MDWARRVAELHPSNSCSARSTEVCIFTCMPPSEAKSGQPLGDRRIDLYVALAKRPCKSQALYAARSRERNIGLARRKRAAAQIDLHGIERHPLGLVDGERPGRGKRELDVLELLLHLHPALSFIPLPARLRPDRARHIDDRTVGI